MKYTLITRPIEDAMEMQKNLAVHGIQSIIEPMLIVEYLPDLSINWDLYSNIIVTSKNALCAVKDHIIPQSIHIICVGQQTAEYAKSIGMKNIEVSGNCARDLIQYIKSKYQSEKFLYLRGCDISINLVEELRDHNIDEKKVYNMVEIDHFSDVYMHNLHQKNIKNILFYSSKTLKVFCKLLKKDHDLSHVNIICLSDNIKNSLNSQKISYKRVISLKSEINTRLLLENINIL